MSRNDDKHGRSAVSSQSRDCNSSNDGTAHQAHDSGRGPASATLPGDPSIASAEGDTADSNRQQQATVETQHRLVNVSQRNLLSVLEDDRIKDQYRSMQKQQQRQQESETLSNVAINRRISKIRTTRDTDPAATHVNPGSRRSSALTKMRQSGAHSNLHNQGSIDNSNSNSNNYQTETNQQHRLFAGDSHVDHTDDENTTMQQDHFRNNDNNINPSIAQNPDVTSPPVAAYHDSDGGYYSSHYTHASQFDSEASIMPTQDEVGAVRLHDPAEQNAQESKDDDSTAQPNRTVRQNTVQAELVEANGNNISDDERARIEIEMRQQMMLEVAQAQMVPPTDEDSSGQSSRNEGTFSKRRCGYLLLAGVCILIIVVLALLAESGQLRGSSNSKNADAPSKESDDPSMSPTEVSDDVPPSQAPSVSSSRLDSSQPTWEVTEVPTNNNFCQWARPIHRDNTTSASFSADLEPIVYFNCEMLLASVNFDVGLWYTYRGELLPVVAKVSEGFTVRVFTIEDLTKCGEAECLPDTIYANETRRASWIADEGVDYYLAIVSSAVSDVETFELTLLGGSI